MRLSMQIEGQYLLVDIEKNKGVYSAYRKDLDKHLAAPSAFVWWFLLLGCGWSGGWPLLRWFLLLSDGAFQLFIMLKDIGQRAIERIAIEKEGLTRCFVICLFLQFWLNGLSLLW